MSIETLFADYRQIIGSMLDQSSDQVSVIEEIASHAAERISAGSVIAVFGTGHSHLLALEGYYRAGGLLPVLAVLNQDLMLHKSAAASTELERLPGLGCEIYNDHKIEHGDVVIVVSNSGRNAVPIDFALAAKEQGNSVVALTSRQVSEQLKPRHEQGKRLFEVADWVIDNHGLVGDAAITPQGNLPKMGPTSTICGSFLLHLLFMRTAEILAEHGHRVPIMTSANLDGGDDENSETITKWKTRVQF